MYTQNTKYAHVRYILWRIALSIWPAKEYCPGLPLIQSKKKTTIEARRIFTDDDLGLIPYEIAARDLRAKDDCLLSLFILTLSFIMKLTNCCQQSNVQCLVSGITVFMRAHKLITG